MPLSFVSTKGFLSLSCLSSIVLLLVKKEVKEQIANIDGVAPMGHLLGSDGFSLPKKLNIISSR